MTLSLTTKERTVLVLLLVATTRRGRPRSARLERNDSRSAVRLVDLGTTSRSRAEDDAQLRHVAFGCFQLGVDDPRGLVSRLALRRRTNPCRRQAGCELPYAKQAARVVYTLLSPREFYTRLPRVPHLSKRGISYLVLPSNHAALHARKHSVGLRKSTP